jgi:hypothetical protein
LPSGGSDALPRLCDMRSALTIFNALNINLLSAIADSGTSLAE